MHVVHHGGGEMIIECVGCPQTTTGRVHDAPAPPDLQVKNYWIVIEPFMFIATCGVQV